MDFEERQRLIRRITSRKLYCNVKFHHENIPVIFEDPLNDDMMSEADWRYTSVYEEYKNSNEFFTLEESYEILKKDGLWSDKLDNELSVLKTDVSQLQSKIASLRFQKAQQRAVEETIRKGKKRITELEQTKHQLYHTTIEAMAENAKRRFIISKITKTNRLELLERPSFLDTLVVYYYKEYALSEAQIRELARTDPWRLYWTVAKETGTPLFSHSAVEVTDLQYALVSWSRIYDFAYESNNRPSDEIIKNDEQFDAWYKDECKRIDDELRKGNAERGLPSGNGFGGQEIFIPADAEGAREVYQLNDANAKIRIAQRTKALEQHGVLPEAELPDIKRDLKMEMNRRANQAAMSRSK